MTEPAYPFSLWLWRMSDPVKPGRRYRTRHRMTEAEALAMDLTAEKVAGSERVITGPATPHSTTMHGRIS